GSKDERRVFAKASTVRPSPRRASEQEGRPPGVSIKIKVSDEMNKGSDFDVFAVITNSTEEEKVCCLTFCAQTTSYSGEVGTECGKKELINLSLPAKGEMTETLRILYETYGSSMTQDNVIKLVAILSENASQEITMEMRDIYLKNPEVKVQILGEPMQKRKLVAQLTLRNPLAEPLTGCSFTVEGAGLTEGQQVKIL
ncbi:hypothetical protein FKM82_024202, partial [Ascaphus truei]